MDMDGDKLIGSAAGRVAARGWRLPWSRRPKPHWLGVLAIMKNEAMNIDEWIAHYLWQGAGQIYLIDNGSTDDTLARARRWERTGKVRVISLTGKWRQNQHYRTAFHHFAIRQQCDWLLMADLDEFWFCKDARTVAQALGDFPKHDLIYTCWSIFGSGGHQTHPDSLRRRLCLRQEKLGDHVNTKWICRTRAIRQAGWISMHKVKGIRRSRLISDNSVFQLNHYVTQSVEYFRKVKLTRGDAANEKSESVRDMVYFAAYDAPCVIEDRRLARQVAQAGSLAWPGLHDEPSRPAPPPHTSA
jgi:glycosyltransferase involved in cell wall biosynthesis